MTHCKPPTYSPPQPHNDRAPEKTSKTCAYSKQIHYAPQAQAYHKDKCVTRTMRKMSDMNGCVEYMAGVSEGQDQMGGCTVADLRQICEKYTHTFTQDHAEQLCDLQNAASREFWRSFK